MLRQIQIQNNEFTFQALHNLKKKERRGQQDIKSVEKRYFAVAKGREKIKCQHHSDGHLTEGPNNKAIQVNNWTI